MSTFCPLLFFLFLAGLGYNPRVLHMLDKPVDLWTMNCPVLKLLYHTCYSIQAAILHSINSIAFTATYNVMFFPSEVGETTFFISHTYWWSWYRGFKWIELFLLFYFIYSFKPSLSQHHLGSLFSFSLIHEP